MSRSLQRTPPVIPNGGINESVSPSQLEARFWTSGLDAEPLPDGVRSRNGYTKENATPIGSSIQGIHGYRLSDDTSEYHLVVANGTLYANESGTMRSLGSGLLTGADDFTSAVVAQDSFLVTNGAAVSKKFIYDGVERWENEGIAPPTTTPALGSVAGTLGGIWWIDYRFRNDNTPGRPVSNSRWLGVGYAGVNNINLGAGPNGIQITGLPAAVARAGDGVTHIEIFMAADASGVPGTFFYVGEVTLGTTSYTISSDTRTTEFLDGDNNVPPKHTIKCVAEGYQFIAGIDGFPGRVMFSKIDGSIVRYESFPAVNFRDFGRRLGDDVTALAFIAPRILIVGFRDSIWALDSRNPALGDPVRIADGVGIAGKNSFIVVGSGIYFISDAAKQKGMFFWPGSGPVQPLFTARNGIDDTFKALNLNRLRYASCAHYAPGDNRFQWWSLVASSGSTHDRVIVYDYQLDAFTIYRISGSVLAQVTEAGVDSPYIGNAAGTEFKLDSGTTDDGSDIASQISLGEWHLGDIAVMKTIRHVRYIAQTFSDGAISMRIECDHGSRRAGVATLSHYVEASGGAFVLGTSVLGGSDTLGSSGSTGFANRRAHPRCSARIFKISFSSTKPWKLRDFEVEFQVSGRR